MKQIKKEFDSIRLVLPLSLKKSLKKIPFLERLAGPIVFSTPFSAYLRDVGDGLWLVIP